LLRSAQISGAMRRALAMSLEHARTRQQFGRPIAKFQAVQHMLADAAGHVAITAALVDNAAEAWGREDFVLRAALAKARAGAAAGPVAAIAHQVHAAMGFTQAHDLHFFTRRLWAWRDEFGSDAHWQGWLGRRVCAAGGAALWPTIVEATA
jgi:acyl-CoA dehydrogenase